MTTIRPFITTPLPYKDKIPEALAICTLVFLFIYTFYNYNRLPRLIPVHYNFSGVADRYGNRAAVWILPVVAAIIYMVMTILNRYLHVCNYPVAVTSNDSKRNHRFVVWLLLWTKLVVLLVLSAINIITISTAVYKVSFPGVWLVPALAASCMLPVIISLIVFIKAGTGIAKQH